MLGGVLGQVRFLREFFRTAVFFFERALERAFTRVFPQMIIEVVELREVLVTAFEVAFQDVSEPSGVSTAEFVYPEVARAWSRLTGVRYLALNTQAEERH